MNFILLISALAISQASAGNVLCDQNCPQNEIYTQCTGPGQATCWNQTQQPQSCSPGCECIQGFVRDPNTFACVDQKSCLRKPPSPRACPANEEFSDCLGGCQRTCDSLDIAFKCKCIPGCVCRDGFVRSALNGQCIRVRECSYCPPGYTKNARTGKCEFCCRECPDNEEFSQCGTYCEADCEIRNFLCIALCKRGCFCKKGYVRDANTGSCIPSEWCPKCLDNEIFSCGNPLCEKTCKNLNEKCTIQPLRCEWKCYCRDGYVRNASGSCVLPAICPEV